MKYNSQNFCSFDWCLFSCTIIAENDIDDALKEESHSQDAPHSESTSRSQEAEEERDRSGTEQDEIGKPEFENAPNVSMDESQEDHTQVSLVKLLSEYW